MPGEYRVRLTLDDGATRTRSFRVMADPRLEADGVTVADMQANFELAIRVRDRIDTIQREVARVHAVLDELDDVASRVRDEDVSQEARRLASDLEEVAGELYKYGERGDHAHLHPELTTSYARLGTMLSGSDHGPTESAYERFEDLEPEYEELMGRVETLLEEDVGALDRTLGEMGVGSVVVPEG